MTTVGNGFRRAAALACLVALAFGPTQFLPEALAFAAGMEGSHTVLVGSGPDGRTEIVLRHGQGDGPVASRFSVPHQHGLASSLICLMADPPQARGDHVAIFAPSVAAENAQKARRIQSRAGHCQPLDVAPATSQFPGPALQLVALFAPSEAPEANFRSMSARARCLRSTHLLI